MMRHNKSPPAVAVLLGTMPVLDNDDTSDQTDGDDGGGHIKARDTGAVPA